MFSCKVMISSEAMRVKDFPTAHLAAEHSIAHRIASPARRAAMLAIPEAFP